METVESEVSEGDGLMPYITQERRDALVAQPFTSQTVGELNYSITKLSTMYLSRGKWAYRELNDVIGVLEAVKLEFYRRAVVPYENQKMAENGDVYDDRRG